MQVRKPIFCASAALLLAACQQPPASAQSVAATDVVDTYVRIAQASYGDSHEAAMTLAEAIGAFLAEPGGDALDAARQAWRDARVPYMQTEVYRFGNPVVDDWEAGVNAWPLDEGLIDYVAPSYGEESDNNFFYTANIIANEQLSIGGIDVDASVISADFLRDTLHMIDGVEANVATGYHAIEFLLWGQDLNGTAPGAGDRPWTDYSLTDCSNGNCERRRAYLQAVTDLLVDDLQFMAEAWLPGGAAFQDLMARGPEGALATMLTGMGSLAYGELAGERTRLALLLGDPEEEHDCFSDNTHWSHYYNAKGIANVYRGRYQGPDGRVVSGPSLHDLLLETAPEAAQLMEARLAETEMAMQALVDQALMGNTFDVLIGPDSEEGEEVVGGVVDALVAETRAIEGAIVALGLTNTSIEGSDSLDDPGAVL